jgi:S1-C subfamily serine protease
MPLRVTCPWCRTAAVVPDAMRGRVAECPACSQPIQVGSAPANVTPAKPRPAGRDTARIQAAPPTRRRRPPEDEDDDDRPARPRRRRRASSGGVSPGVWVCCGVGGLAALMVLIVVIVRAFSPAPAVPQVVPVVVEQRAEAPLAVRNPEPLRPQAPPVAAPEPDDPPPGPLPAQISREALAKVKKATVYIRARVRNGLSQGTGFFAVEKDLVVTNAHVLNMHQSNQAPQSIEVICDSGEPTERVFPAQLLGAVQNRDLAVLRVQGADLPEPLPVRPAKYLTELQKVYVFGFPFGEQLGKNITVSESSVSSLRKYSRSDELKEVQVNGGMQPGNSGGPVVDTSGHVVGVAVSIIRGTQINFAIPGEHVRGYLRDLLGPRRR